MKKFALRIAVFFLILFTCYLVFAIYLLPNLLEKYIGPSDMQQIEFSAHQAENKEYDLLLLGNSKLYRGLNPALFTLKTYNFSNANDSYNQKYFKLKFLEKKNKSFKYLILGIDYFEFNVFSDTRNYEYGSIFDDSYFADYPTKNYAFSHYFNRVDIENVKALLLYLQYGNKHYLNENGQYRTTGITSESDTITRSIKRIQILEKYFSKIIEHCNQKKVKVFLLLMPLREVEINMFINSYVNKDVVLLNYTNDKRLSVKDYSDACHLNEKGADKFSKMLNDTIMSIIKAHY
jgi:hypothetical protein